MFKSSVAETLLYLITRCFQTPVSVISHRVDAPCHLSGAEKFWILKLKNSEFWSRPKGFRNGILDCTANHILQMRQLKLGGLVFPWGCPVHRSGKSRWKCQSCRFECFALQFSRSARVGAQDQSSGLWDPGHTFRAMASFHSNLETRVLACPPRSHHWKELPFERTQLHPEEGSFRD